MPEIVRLTRQREELALDVTAFYRTELSKLKNVYFTPERVREMLAKRNLTYFQELARQGNLKVTPKQPVTRVQLALDGEQLVGVRETTDYAMEQGGEVVGLTRALIWLLPEPKGRGTGTLLLNDMIENSEGVDALALNVAQTNKGARKLYRGRGFEYCCVQPGHENQLVPNQLWVKPLTQLGYKTLRVERKRALAEKSSSK